MNDLNMLETLGPLGAIVAAGLALGLLLRIIGAAIAAFFGGHPRKARAPRPGSGEHGGKNEKC